MSNVVPMGEGGLAFTPRHRSQAAKARRQSEVEVYRHGLAAAVRAECDIHDSLATSAAAEAALHAEIGLLEWGLHRVQGSAAGLELVARKVHLLALLNDRRISRRFGA